MASTDPRESESRAVRSRGNQSANGSTVTLGFMPAPEIPEKIARELAAELPQLLDRRVDVRLSWDVSVFVDPLTGSERDAPEILDVCRDRRVREGWDMAVCLTDLPIYRNGHLVVADASASRGSPGSRCRPWERSGCVPGPRRRPSSSSESCTRGSRDSKRTPVSRKTALVTVATSDDAVQGAFSGGTFWVFLGPSADVVEELGRLARRLGSVVEGRPHDLAEARARVASLLPEDRTLLVVDDASSTSDAAAFRVAESGATVLFTTRDREVARQLSPGRFGPLVLEELSEEDALELLGRLAPDTVELHRSGAEELGGMPLAIRVAGRLLAAEERMGWGVESLLAELREGRRVLGSEAPADRLPVPEGASPTVAALLQTSLERLPTQAVDRFRVLGVFPAKPTSFDLAAAASVWAADEEDARGTIRELEGRGLLEPAGAGRFYLHESIICINRRYVRRCTGPSSRHGDCWLALFSAK